MELDEGEYIYGVNEGIDTDEDHLNTPGKYLKLGATSKYFAYSKNILVNDAASSEEHIEGPSAFVCP